MILSCMTQLTDNQTKEKPTVYDEWQSRSYPLWPRWIDAGATKYKDAGRLTLQDIYRNLELRTSILQAFGESGICKHQTAC